MSSRSLNKVQLIGNLTRDPELRYTPQGTAVCTFGLATNRSWTTDSGEKREDAEFHRIVAWNKLAELCSQLLFKGRKTYVEGRLQTRSWTAQDGSQKQTTEVVIEEMIILDSRQAEGVSSEAPLEPEVSIIEPTEVDTPVQKTEEPLADEPKKEEEPKTEKKKKQAVEPAEETPAVEPKTEEDQDALKSEDIPF